MAALTVVTPEQIQQQMNTAIIPGTPTTTCFLLTTTSPTNHHHAATAAANKTSSSRRSLSKIAPKRRSDSDQTSASSCDSNSNAEVGLRCKRRIQFVNSGASAPTGVARRNERERNRVRQVNLGFATLRQHVPNGAKSKKMSKVETLRSAVQYIKQLQQLLSDSSQNEDENNIPAFAERSLTHQGQLDKCHQMNYNITASAHCSAASSPTPSLGSDASSTYDSLSPEDENLLDFATWLS